ncbi:hypothetical protein LXL04_037665 [Taraxacum kok-saghyz]
MIILLISLNHSITAIPKSSPLNRQFSVTCSTFHHGIRNKGWWYRTNFFERGKSVVWSKIRVYDTVFFIDQSFCIRPPLLLFLFIQEYHQFSKSYLPEIDCVKVFKIRCLINCLCKNTIMYTFSWPNWKVEVVIGVDGLLMNHHVGKDAEA